MNHPITYYGNNPRNPLIKDIIDTWGEYLQDLEEADALWFIARIAHQAWLEYETDQPPSDAVEEATKRLYELNGAEKIKLITAIVNS